MAISYSFLIVLVVKHWICNDSGFYNYCSFNMSPGNRVKSQMTTVDCEKTKDVTNFRTHVELAINRIREFKILKNALPANALT